MNRDNLFQYRTWIVSGYVLTVVGSVAYFFVLVHLGYFTSNGSASFDLEVVLPVLANGAALFAWRWMTMLDVTGDDQFTYVRRAAYGLGVQSLFTAGSILAGVAATTAASNPDQLIVTALVVEAIGGVVTFIGFVMMAGRFMPRRELPMEFARETSAQAPLSPPWGAPRPEDE